ncbi:MAG: sulfatase, partial [Armatimonadota bacterium]|nr:sulfatase [Armatimonadota bacterium]
LVYVFADQLRFQSLGYAGDGKAITPHIDRFAAEGVNFANAVASSPVCTAYRASLLTGKYTTSHGMVINELRMNPHQRGFGHVLTEGGYQTAYIGKWHLYANELGHHDAPKNSFVPRGPHRLGFDGEWKAYNFHHENYGTYYHTESPAKIFYGEGVYEPDAQTDFAIGFLQRASKNTAKPFALFLSWGPPHDPWGPDNVPAKFWEMYEGVSFPNTPNYRSDNDAPYADDWATLDEREREQLESWRRGYYAQMTSVDANFGRLLRALDESGFGNDTIVVFTSDHGEMFGAHGRRAKNIFYEEACHIPLLLRWPGHVPTGHVSDACLSTVDLMPTLLSLLELPCPADVEGMDLSHCALGRPGPEPDAALMQICGATAAWEDGHEWRALRDKRYTYAIYRVDGKEFLFDNHSDPDQMHNLAGNVAHADTLERFRRMLAAKLESLNDGFETCTWYRDHWTDGDRNIIRSATQEFSDGGKEA